MKSYLWKIKKDKLVKTNLALYSNFIKKNFNINVENDFSKLWEWSIKHPENFWKSIWDFTKIKGKMGNISIKKSNLFYKNKPLPRHKIPKIGEMEVTTLNSLYSYSEYNKKKMKSNL